MGYQAPIIKNIELGSTPPDLSSIGIEHDTLERLGVVEARTSIGRRFAFVYDADCVKLMAFDGSYRWSGEYVPDIGLFGQKHAKAKNIVLFAHEYDMLRVQSVIDSSGGELRKDVACVCVPSDTPMGHLSVAAIADQLKMVVPRGGNILVWHGTTFSKQATAVESMALAIDSMENAPTVKSLALSRGVAPLGSTPNEIVRVLNGARTDWYPDAVSRARDIFNSEDFFQAKIGISTGFPLLDMMTRGYRRAELVMLTAGTGVGKSTLLRQQTFHMAFVENKRIAVAFLEETKKETLQKYAAIHYKIPLVEMQENPNALSKQQWEEFLALPQIDNLFWITQPDMKHGAGSGGFGGMGVDELLNSIRYLTVRHDIEFAAIDHLSIIISGKESSKEGERKDIDIMMSRLATACVTLNIGIIGVCHLSQPDGTPHEEGGRVLLTHLRGSGSLKQLSWCIIAQERDQQDGGSNLVLIRVLKNRNGGGKTGPCCIAEFVDPCLVERPEVSVIEWLETRLDRSRAKKKGSFGSKATGHMPTGGTYGHDTSKDKRVTFGKLGDK